MNKNYQFDNVTIQLVRHEEWSNDGTQVWWDVTVPKAPQDFLFEIYETYDAALTGNEQYPSRQTVLRYMVGYNVASALLSERERAEAERLMLDYQIARAERNEANALATYNAAVALARKLDIYNGWVHSYGK